MEFSTFLWTTVGAFLTLATFSFLYKDNPFYKLAEHLYVGVSAGYWLIYVAFFDVEPMLIDTFLTETGVEKWLILIPGALGLIMLSRWFPRTAWPPTSRHSRSAARESGPLLTRSPRHHSSSRPGSKRTCSRSRSNSFAHPWMSPTIQRIGRH